jgi:hypothetical protein
MKDSPKEGWIPVNCGFEFPILKQAIEDFSKVGEAIIKRDFERIEDLISVMKVRDELGKDKLSNTNT